MIASPPFGLAKCNACSTVMSDIMRANLVYDRRFVSTSMVLISKRAECDVLVGKTKGLPGTEWLRALSSLDNGHQVAAVRRSRQSNIAILNLPIWPWRLRRPGRNTDAAASAAA